MQAIAADAALSHFRLTLVEADRQEQAKRSEAAPAAGDARSPRARYERAAALSRPLRRFTSTMPTATPPAPAPAAR